MELYFLRHGRSVARKDWDRSDDERPLTTEGRSDLVIIADALSSLGVHPDVITSSPLFRARETAEIAAEGLGMKDKLVVDDRLGEGFSAKRLRKMLSVQDGARSIMFVGHEPDLSGVIRKLTGADALLSMGSLARVDVTDADVGEGKLVWLLPADVLKAQGLATKATELRRREQPHAARPAGERGARRGNSGRSRETKKKAA